jgi:protein TonB
MSEEVTLEDIVFSGRNKAYGAYALQKKYRIYLLTACLISLAGVSTSIAVPFLRAFRNPVSKVGLTRTVSVEMQPVKTEEIPLPPPPPVMPEEMKNQVRYLAPVLVEDPPPEPELITMGEALEKTDNPAVMEITNAVEPTPSEIDEPDMKTYFFPEEHASFMNGNVDDFRKWVQENVVYPVQAIDHGISGKVIVEFCVNSKGEVVEVHVIRAVDPSLDNESVKVISTSPLWKAARQGGEPVKQHFVIPVVFILQQ